MMKKAGRQLFLFVLVCGLLLGAVGCASVRPYGKNGGLTPDDRMEMAVGGKDGYAMDSGSAPYAGSNGSVQVASGQMTAGAWPMARHTPYRKS